MYRYLLLSPKVLILSVDSNIMVQNQKRMKLSTSMLLHSIVLRVTSKNWIFLNENYFPSGSSRSKIIGQGHVCLEIFSSIFYLSFFNFSFFLSLCIDLVWYCQFDVSPVNYSDFDRNNCSLRKHAHTINSNIVQLQK